MKNTIKKTLVFLAAPAFLFGVPHFVSAAIVPCSDASTCNFDSLRQLAANIMQFLLLAAGIVAAILFAYAGFLYVFAAGNEGQIKKAHSLFKDAGIGLVLMGAAWLIVEVILQTLGYKGTLGSF